MCHPDTAPQDVGQGWYMCHPDIAPHAAGLGWYMCHIDTAPHDAAQPHRAGICVIQTPHLTTRDRAGICVIQTPHLMTLDTAGIQYVSSRHHTSTSPYDRRETHLPGDEQSIAIPGC